MTTKEEYLQRMLNAPNPTRRNGGSDGSPGALLRAAIGDGLHRGQLPDTTVRVASAEQLAEMFRLRAFDVSPLQLEPDAPRLVGEMLSLAALLPLLTIVPTDSLIVPTVLQTVAVDDADWAPDATNLPGTQLDGTLTGGSAVFELDRVEAQRVGRMVGPISLTDLQSPGQLEAVVGRLITRTWRRAVEDIAISGRSHPALQGVLTAGVTTIDAGGGGGAANIDAVAAAAVRLVNAGFASGHVLVGQQSDLNKLFTAKDLEGNYLRWRSALPTVAAVVPTKAPGLAGQLLLLDPAELVVYIHDGFSVQVTQNIMDYVSRGVAAIAGWARIVTWLSVPSAAVIIDDLG
jgi:hypothetical protein